ncbi:ABC transporter permease [Maledivibacter halophilus]|uniref:Peptide/nickel transport system permease protein n=1 Tax=Maledivibacter halophilus TaxID=36842 RepID=A0A1T5LK43_9FIRM|nr:ABC transporter permease [Maledivibacter halophilus]SKC76145.1 peptide/nickel transport system permease protein [Maledivibacter halophilus]
MINKSACKEVSNRKVKEHRWEKEIKIFLNHKLGMLGLGGVVFLILIALLAPIISEPVSGYGNYEDKLLAPSANHWFGTDDMGLDLFSQVIWGTRASIKVGLIAVFVAMIIGIPIGLMSGYFGGIYETLGMGLTEVFLTIPMLPLMIITAAVSESTTINTVALIIGIFSWPSIARITRSSTLRVCGMQYIEAAKSLGLKTRSIIFKHILINASTPVFVNLTIVMATSIITESAISFLGLGDPLAYSWGKILHNAYLSGAFSTAWWYSLFPSIGIMLFVISFNFLSMGVRDALNPKISRE